MRTALGFAAALVAGGAAVAAGAGTLTVPSKWFGSDTLQDVTWDVLGQAGSPSVDNNLASGQSGNYLAGGSGAGQSAMANSAAASSAPQVAAPMSKMMTNGVCGTTGTPVFGLTTGAAAQNASGIVVGMDAVDVYAAIGSVEGASQSPICTSPNSGAQTTDGLASSGTSTSTIFTGATTGQNWKWILALLYGGLDYSNPTAIPDCNSQARRNLVANWSNFFQNGCTNGNGGSGGICGDATHLAQGQGGTASPLWHAFRRDDASGTSDVFSAVLGIQGTGGALAPSTSKLNGFGISPYCNAMNWDQTSNNGSCGNTGGTTGHDQFLGPGGIQDPNSVCTTTALAKGTTTCSTSGGNHRKPPTGTWGDAPSLGYAMEVLPTSLQDNDPIRRPCLGSTAGNQAASAEEVCNTDNNLGVVLAIPATDFIPTLNLQQYPTTLCFGSATGGPFLSSAPPKVFTCALSSGGTHAAECANGDSQFGGNCFAPSASTSAGTQCLNGKTNRASIFTRSNVKNVDGRVHNLHMYNGGTSGTPQYIPWTIQNGKATPLTYATFVGGMGRIHSVSTIWNTAATPTTPPNVGCQMKDATDQIACLTQADPCSFGYAGDGGKTWYTRGSGDGNTGTLCSSLPLAGSGGVAPAACNTAGALVSESIRVDGVYPNAGTVQALGSQNFEYQLSRKLYYNSIAGFGALETAVGAGLTGWTDTSVAGEVDFAAFESVASNTQPILSAIGYFTLSPTQAPNGYETTADGGTGLTKPFCEDFNQATVCADGTLNDNACARNGGSAVAVAGYGAGSTYAALGYQVALPGESNGPDAGAYAAGGGNANSTVCGNGIQEAYEECDDGANNGTTGDPCSTTCRCAGVFTFKSVGGGPYMCQ